MTAKKKKPANPYPREPRTLTELSWFYEEPDGIHVVMECRVGDRPDGAYHGTVTAIVPWKDVIAAIDVHRKINR